jgi:hypothetical protein
MQRYEDMKTDNLYVRRERDAARRECTRVTKAYQSLQREYDQFRQRHSLRFDMFGSGKLSDAERKKLLQRFRPDKWSQGQLAIEVCHELSVYFNE